jgi:hypothetical protein
MKLLVIALVLACACDKGKRAEETQRGSAAPCVVGGCNGEACYEDNGNFGATACVMLDEHACYGTAKCERQPDGSCDWTPTAELTSCIATARANKPPPVAAPPSAPVVTP